MEVEFFLNNLDKLKKKEIYYISKSVSFIENHPFEGLKLIGKLCDKVNKITPVLGITGVGGAGKSTTLGKLLPFLFKSYKTIAVLAVDPCNKKGGALLGDRLRIKEKNFNKEQFFFRSFSSRGYVGGINIALFNTIQLLKFCGFNLIIVESTGIGQDEVIIRDIVDYLILILVPFLGDDIQFMKAGILDSADMYVLNKSKNVRNINYIREALENVILTEATEGKGIEKIYKQLIKKIKVKKKNNLFKQILKGYLALIFDDYFYNKKVKILNKSKNPYIEIYESLNELKKKLN